MTVALDAYRTAREANLQALRVPVIQLLASASGSALSSTSPAITTTLAVLGHKRASRGSRLGVDDGRGGCSRRGLNNGGRWVGLSGRGGLTDICRDGVALVDHSCGARAVLNWVATWEGIEVYRTKSDNGNSLKELIRNIQRPSVTSSTRTF